ncbi:MAG: glycosyltransferase [Actinomycetota bacterium]|nr:glycosyltransferase [Actinomycetota bacterium]
MTGPVALVHDYLTQRGGAERVVLAMLEAFPGAPLYTALYHPERTFPEFRDVDVRAAYLDRVAPFRARHRLALPLLADAFSRLHVTAPVVLCSTSGWSHGAQVTGRRILYCHSPARWLYQTDRYLGERAHPLAAGAMSVLKQPLLRWDQVAAARPARWLTNSTLVQDSIRTVYGREAEVIPPPYALDPAGTRIPADGLEPGFFLTVSRLLPYKNVGSVVEAFAGLPDQRLVVVGTGPAGKQLRQMAGRNVTFLGTTSDGQLRWLYANCRAVVAASYEDYGLTPLEGAAFGKPAVVLRWGGFLDTVRDGVTGVYFDEPTPSRILAAVRTSAARPWDPATLQRHADAFSKRVFIDRIRRIVDEEARRPTTSRPVSLRGDLPAQAAAVP